MNHRFYNIWLAISFFSGAANAAGSGAWNCEQTKNGEWTCLNKAGSDVEQAKPQVVKPPRAEAVQQPAPQVVQSQPQPPQPSPRELPDQQPSVQPVAQSEQKPEQPEAKPVAEKPVAEPQKMRVRLTENQKPQREKVETAREPVTTAAAKQPGWNCKSGDDKQNWNCNLVGPDPKGEARVVADAEMDTHWLTPAFSHGQERTFQTLRGEFERDPWQNCQTWSAKKQPLKTASQEEREIADTNINADSSEIFEGDVLNFAGNVDLTRADQHLMSDKLSYDTVAETMDAQGNVIYSESTLALAGDTVSMSLGKDEARLRKALFIAGDGPIRGSSETVYRESKSLSRYNEAAFTSCPPGDQDWVAHASRLKINRESGLGAAKNAWLEFKGVPFLYTPYISFPVDNRRTTGLLAPSFGNTQRNGFDFTAPFYWNIAPNYDDVITPRYMAKRGGMLRNKFRYMTESSTGALGTEILPYDQLKDKSRYSATFQDKTTYARGLSSNIDLNYVSDEEYFNDLNNALGFQTNSFLPSTAYMYYSGIPGASFSTGIHHYQSVDKSIPDTSMPYDILPRVNLGLAHNFENMPVALAMSNEFSHFYHSDLVNGQRINLAPSISLPLESSAGFLIPKITGQYTQYQLTDQNINETRAGLPTSVSRALPIFSVDTGLMFERNLDIGDSGYTHTLEPRAFYLYIPRKDQTDIPIFDTAAYDTNFYSLFRENRFSGNDRIQDANQITLGGTSRFIDNKTGLEPLKISLGQIIYFQDRTVDLDYKGNSLDANGNFIDRFPRQTSSTSNFVGELSGQITKHLSYTTGAQWDPISNGFARTQAGLRYRNQPNQIFDIGYRWRNNNPNDLSALSQSEISQSDVSFRWPLAVGWYGIGRWQYSFNFAKTTESFIGIEKETCCWRLRFIGRRYINGANTTNILAPDAKPENAFFVQLELKGLTSFGDDVDQFLMRNLNGYRPANYFDD